MKKFIEVSDRDYNNYRTLIFTDKISTIEEMTGGTHFTMIDGSTQTAETRYDEVLKMLKEE